MSGIDIFLGYALKYGPELVLDVVNLLKKKGITVDEIETIFANVKPYSAFGIPDVAPTAPVPA